MSGTTGNWPGGLRVDGNRVYGSPVQTTGNVFFVDSGAANGSDVPGHGRRKERPFATLDYAVGRCTANNGDVIYVMPGHVESVIAAGGLTLDVAGITIVFLGNGDDRATISFGTAVGADMEVDAAGVTLINPRFEAAIDALTGPIDVDAADFTIIGGEWYDGTTIDTTDCIVADANADRMKIYGWTYHVGDGAGTQKQSQIQVAAATDVELVGLRIAGDFGTGVVENGTAWVNALLDDCILENQSVTPTVAILLQATSSGTMRDVQLRIASGVTYLTAGNDMQFFNVSGVGTDAGAGTQIGILEDTATNFIGVDDANNVADTTNVAANENGSILERLEQLQEAVNIGTGTSLGANKSLVDALGTDGVTPIDSAVSVLGAIGINDADNAFSSSSVVANVDGSVLERLEAIMDPTGAYVPGLGYRVTKTSTTSGTADDIFDVTGTIMATAIIGEVTTGFGTVTTCKLNIKTDNVDLCAATTITSDADGTMYFLSGDTGAIMNVTDIPVLRLAQLSGGAHTPIIIGNAGVACVIEQTLDQAGTGAVLWTMYYFPMSATATVTASA